MEPVPLPRPEFALCKVGRWSLYRLSDGRLVAHRPSFETVRKGDVFRHEPKYIASQAAA